MCCIDFLSDDEWSRNLLAHCTSRCVVWQRRSLADDIDQPCRWQWPPPSPISRQDICVVPRTQNTWRQEFRGCRSADVKRSTVLTGHRLRTVPTATENILLEINRPRHRDCLFICALETLLLTYLLTYLVTYLHYTVWNNEANIFIDVCENIPLGPTGPKHHTEAQRSGVFSQYHFEVEA